MVVCLYFLLALKDMVILKVIKQATVPLVVSLKKCHIGLVYYSTAFRHGM